MTFKNIKEIKEAGFVGFVKMGELFHDTSCIPPIKGVYFILKTDKKPPEFLSIGTGGYFNGENPNVSIAKLKSNWVEGIIVIYIGKGGGFNKKKGVESYATLKSRLKTFISFGNGNKAAHRGGKYIWQLKNSAELLVCWLPTPEKEPTDIETYFITEFKKQYNQRPFANNRG